MGEFEIQIMHKGEGRRFSAVNRIDSRRTRRAQIATAVVGGCQSRCQVTIVAAFLCVACGAGCAAQTRKPLVLAHEISPVMIRRPQVNKIRMAAFARI